MLLQQGDILLERCDEIKGEKQAHLILSESKVTGHKHEIVGNAELFLDGTDMYLKVIDTVKLVHEEHKSIEVERGNYKVRKAREYDHFEEQAKEVED